ncbi:MAG: ABC transporter permease [Bacteroidales bacterium]|nr:ABC transporter permease [Bacteroidales bacterium]
MVTFFRFLANHRLFTMINILGFALSLAFLLLLGDLVYRQSTVESFQTRGDRTYIVGNEHFQMSNFRQGEQLAAKFPEIEDWCAIGGYGMPLLKDGVEIETKTLVVRDNYFSFFDYGLQTGDKSTVLSDISNIVVSRSFADKYYEDEEVIGKQLELDVYGEKHVFTISGIMDDFDRSVIPSEYECVIPLENLKYIHSSAYNEDMGNAGAVITYLMEREGSDLKARCNDMADYFRTYFWLYKNGVAKEVLLTPLSDFYYNNYMCELNSGELNHGNRSITFLYIIIGILVLVFAIFNYVNLSVTLTSERSKEMATRRLLGSQKNEIFLRLMSESIIFTAISFFIGMIAALALQDKASMLVNCKIDLFKDLVWWHTAIAALAICFVGFLAGMAPSSILSQYKPIDIVRGTFRRIVRQRWSHVLMIIQTTFTLVMLATVLILSGSIEEKMNTPLGYEYENIAEVQGQFDSLAQMKTARDQILALPEVESVGMGYSTPMSWLENQTMNADDGTVVSLRIMMGDSAMFNILNIHPCEEFEKDDPGNGVVCVNKYLYQLMHLPDDARSFTLHSGDYERTYTVGAIYPDIVYQSVISGDAKSPFIYYKVDEYEDGDRLFNVYGMPRNYLVKYNPNATTIAQLNEKMKKIISSVTGHEGFESSSLSDQHYNWYAEYDRFLKVLKVFTILAFIISILGLLAMNSYFISNRKREIAVRKVLGSSTMEVIVMLMRIVMIQFAVAVALSIPLSMWLSPMVASMSGLTIGMEWGSFGIATISIATVIIITVLVQSLRAASENPINNIKTE